MLTERRLLFACFASLVMGVMAATPWANAIAIAHGPNAHQHPEGSGDDVVYLDAQGVVFNDLNGNRVRDDGEAGIPGVHVSNGKEIVTTDEDGRYIIKVTDDTIVFVIKPRNWMTPVNEDQLPQFYYIHKPQGSPPNFKYPGVAPTGPLPASIDFPLIQREEPETFRALMFGDTQPRNVEEVEYMAHDVIEQIIAEQGHGASFGVTLGDIVFDDLSVMKPLNQTIALIGIPWYNVIGNHDMNYDAPNDQLSDETYEQHYGPNYYSFNHGPAHFIVVDDVTWVGAQEGQRAHYHGGLGARQMEFIRNDLNLIPKDQLVVLMMHIPLNEVDDRQELYRLIEQRPATVSISAHTHYMEHRLIGKEDGWMGAEPHHHIVNVTVCGSWWSGQPDERGIPHTMMSDGAPNGYSIMEFNGNEYTLEFRSASRPAEHQMMIHAPETVQRQALPTTVVLANVFNAVPTTACHLRVGEGPWKPMEQVTIVDPAFVATKSRDETLKDRKWRDLPAAHATPHMYRAMLPVGLPLGTHTIEVKAELPGGKEVIDHRIIRIDNPE